MTDMSSRPAARLRKGVSRGSATPPKTTVPSRSVTTPTGLLSIDHASLQYQE